MDLNSSVTPPLRANGCGFYGTKENRNMRSKCYKDFLKALITNANKSPNLLDAGVQKPDNPVETNLTQSRTSSSETNSATLDSCAETSSTASRGQSRCENRKKKIGLTGFKCRCGHLFCGKHRYSREHACTFDFMKIDREILVKNNQLIKPDKLAEMI